MKNQLTLFIVFLISLSNYAQERKVELVADSLFSPRPNTEVSRVLTCVAYACGVEVVTVPFGYELPFKVYGINASKENWNTTQDVYNSIQSKVSGISISSITFSNQTPIIKMRGDANTVVIIDGIRYDASILNTLNPSDIEHITVAPSAAATNYFINN